MTRVMPSRDGERCRKLLGCAKIQSMKNRSNIEPGLLSLFRLLTVIRLGLLVLVGFELQARAGSWVPVLLSLADGLLLLGYLSWPALERTLGRLYLPIALGIAVVGPILIQHAQAILVPNWRSALSLTTWQLLPVLLIPVVLTAWQYGFRATLVVIAGAVLLDLGLAPFSIALDQNLPPFPAHFEVELTRSFLVALAGRMVTLLVASYTVSRVVQAQREQSAALAQANTRLIGYATTLEQLATSQERNRLARELHDTLAHSLSAMAVQLDAVDCLWDTSPGEARMLLEQALATTREGLAETRRALQALRSSPLEDLGLGLAVRALAESAGTRGHLMVNVQVPEVVKGLSPEAEQCIYRVVQEALENIVQHANARRLEVHLDVQNKCVTLTMSDDGQGFDVDAVLAEGRYGLQGMRERAEMAGGTLDLTSAAGRGTTVRLTLKDKYDDPRTDLR
jgi:signal transduction histidine kinase